MSPNNKAIKSRGCSESPNSGQGRPEPHDDSEPGALVSKSRLPEIGYYESGFRSAESAEPKTRDDNRLEHLGAMRSPRESLAVPAPAQNSEIQYDYGDFNISPDFFDSTTSVYSSQSSSDSQQTCDSKTIDGYSYGFSDLNEDSLLEISVIPGLNTWNMCFDISSELVGAYFRVVCPIFSTFDSDQNIFRTFVDRNWQTSSLVFHTIQSMSAAKLAWIMPEMKADAIQYRSSAFKALRGEIQQARGWSSSILLVIIMLGISSCWFDTADLGVVHLEAAQKAFLDNEVQFSDDLPGLDFFRNALVYWEMVCSTATDRIKPYDHKKTSQYGPGLPIESTNAQITPKIAPHPWTGIASEPQALFTRVVRHIRRLRTFEPTPIDSSPVLEAPRNFLGAIGELEQELWAQSLPMLHEIVNIGDQNTPAIHHLLLAEAYMFANFYQLYLTFPEIRRERARLIKDQAYVPIDIHSSWADLQKRAWSSMLEQDEGTDRWLKFLGQSILIRLEQIQESSGTSCVQALLLLIGAGSLSWSPSLEGHIAETEIMQHREFVLKRLTFLSESKLSAPIQLVKSAVLEMFKRMGFGVDVFWMDILQSM